MKEHIVNGGTTPSRHAAGSSWKQPDNTDCLLNESGPTLEAVHVVKSVHYGSELMRHSNMFLTGNMRSK